MNIRQLEYFLVLAKHEHLTKAADILNISQPALSSMIKSLEDDLGTKLFDRIGRRIVLNSAGEVYKEYVERAFHDLDEGKLAINEMQNHTESMRINIASTCPRVTCHLMRYLMELHPQLSFTQHTISDDRIPHFLESKNCSFAITSDQDFNKTIKKQFLFKDGLMLAVSSDSEIANKHLKSIDIRNVKDYKFIALNKYTSLQESITNSLESIGLSLNYSIECDSTTRLEMVSKGYGFSISTTLTAATENAFGNITFIPISNPEFVRTLYIYSYSDRFNPAYALQVENEILEIAQNISKGLVSKEYRTNFTTP